MNDLQHFVKNFHMNLIRQNNTLSSHLRLHQIIDFADKIYTISIQNTDKDLKGTV